MYKILKHFISFVIMVGLTIGDYYPSQTMSSIVFGNNSCFFQAGFGGEDAPRAVFPCVVGRPKQRNILTTGWDRAAWVGDECYSRCGITVTNRPVKDGIITNWDDIEKIWHHTFYNELRVAPEEHLVLLAETPWNSKQDREKMTQIMLETFSVQGFCLANQDVLSLYASGKTTGLVLDSGATSSHATPIFDGNALPQAMCKTNIGGDDITNLFIKLVAREDKSYIFETSAEREIAVDIKQKICYIKTNPLGSHEARTYELPDGNVLTLTESLFKCTEPLFNNKRNNSIQDMVQNAIRKCDKSVQQHLYSNIVLSGGNTMFAGFSDRLTKELKQYSVNVHANQDRKYFTWIGGSILASLDVPNIWITHDMYEEFGCAIVHRMCPRTSYQAESKLYTKPVNFGVFQDIKINT